MAVRMPASRSRVSVSIAPSVGCRGRDGRRPEQLLEVDELVACRRVTAAHDSCSSARQIDVAHQIEGLVGIFLGDRSEGHHEAGAGHGRIDLPSFVQRGGEVHEAVVEVALVEQGAGQVEQHGTDRLCRGGARAGWWRRLWSCTQIRLVGVWVHRPSGRDRVTRRDRADRVEG